MAHPDEGYLIPDEIWEGDYDPDIDQNSYPDDSFAWRRRKLVMDWQERGDKHTGSDFPWPPRR